jgi:hypothetical protein
MNIPKDLKYDGPVPPYSQYDGPVPPYYQYDGPIPPYSPHLDLYNCKGKAQD